MRSPILISAFLALSFLANAQTTCRLVALAYQYTAANQACSSGFYEGPGYAITVDCYCYGSDGDEYFYDGSGYWLQADVSCGAYLGTCGNGPCAVDSC